MTTTVVDLAPRIAARSRDTTPQMSIASVIELPARRSARHQHETDLAVEQLLVLLTQSVSFSHHPSVPTLEKGHYRGQIAAYAYAAGIVCHPGDPEAAQEVKAALVEAIAKGANTVEELIAVIQDAEVPPNAG